MHSWARPRILKMSQTLLNNLKRLKHSFLAFSGEDSRSCAILFDPIWSYHYMALSCLVHFFWFPCSSIKCWVECLIHQVVEFLWSSIKCWVEGGAWFTRFFFPWLQSHLVQCSGSYVQSCRLFTGLGNESGFNTQHIITRIAVRALVYAPVTSKVFIRLICIRSIS